MTNKATDERAALLALREQLDQIITVLHAKLAMSDAPAELTTKAQDLRKDAEDLRAEVVGAMERREDGRS